MTMIWWTRHQVVCPLVAPTVAPTVSSAPTSSIAEAKRSAGALRMQRAITATSGAGTSGHRAPSGLGSLPSTRATVASSVAGRERVHAARELVEQHAEREDVDARVGRLAVDLLGRHVGRRADDDAGAGRERRRRRADAPPPGRGVPLRGSIVPDGAVVDDPREAEVENLQPAVARPHHVLGLEVAMHDAARVRAGQRRRELARGRKDLARRRALAGCDLVAERVAVHDTRWR